MTRPSREQILGDGFCTVHLTTRCINGEFLLKDRELKWYLYEQCLKYKFDHDIKVDSYRFMDSHIHLVLKIGALERFSAFMRVVFGNLGRFVNKRLKRKGHVFGERCQTPVIDTRTHHLNTLLYLDYNPVRAGMTKSPGEHTWGSFGFYALGEYDPLIDEASTYQALSDDPEQRRIQYRQISLDRASLNSTQQPEYTSWFFIGESDWITHQMVTRGFWNPKKRSRPPP